jgi:hypothetical protein
VIQHHTGLLDLSGTTLAELLRRPDLPPALAQVLRDVDNDEDPVSRFTSVAPEPREDA